MRLFCILLLAFFFRTYKIIEQFSFGHDADLFSWIAKDIVINHHYRLIGQLTSAPGIFIGSFYYYLNIPFFLLTNMDPVGAIVPITIIGMLTVFSYYWVFKKLFNTQIGIISSLIYSVSHYTVQFDRWIVPSTLTNLWVIWYFYVLINISRGNFFVLPILGILIGLIWHIHIALAPALVAIPIAIFLANRLPDKKQIVNSLISLFVTSIPLLIFELRHNFQQTLSFVNNFMTKHPGETGISKLAQVLGMVNKNLADLIFSPDSFAPSQHIAFLILFLSMGFLLLVKKKILEKKVAISLLAWVLGVIIFFTVSSTLISEYYFSNLVVIFILLISGVLTVIWNYSKLGKIAIIILFTLLIVKNLYYLMDLDYYNKGYLERKAVAKFITTDSKQKDYPCVGITYITSPGENVGFRYFFWLFNLKTAKPSLEVPVYNIVIPDELSLHEIDKKFGHIGVIVPKKVGTKKEVAKACVGENTNLTEPMLGFVN